MKSIIVGVIILFGINNCFSQNRTELEDALQTALQMEDLEKIFHQDEDGDIYPLTIKTNGHIPENLQINHNGHPVDLIAVKNVAATDSSETIIDLSSVEMKKNKKIKVHFEYNDIEVKIKLSKFEGKWTKRSLSMMGNGVRHKTINYEF